MKTAILGGGITGLVAAYELSKKKHAVTLFEKEDVLGGMAGGFKDEGWEWYLEKTYHHIFKNDSEIFDFISSIQYEGVFFKEPKTVSLYPPKGSENNYRTFPVDTPQDFLRFPLLSLPEKLRAGVILAFLKISPHFSLYEKHTAQEFLKKTMGQRVWSILWEELFRKKFGNNAENIIASFIWARIKKRTRELGYMKGGFQTLIDFIEEKDVNGGAIIHKNTDVLSMAKKEEKYTLVTKKNNDKNQEEDFDAVISTVPTPIFLRVAGDVLPGGYIKQLAKIKYLDAVSLILETDKPFFNNEYWVNMVDKKAPMMVLVQHTNFIDKKHYNNKHILYCANYVEKEHPLWNMRREEVVKYHIPYIQKITNNNQKILQSHVFRAPFAQPLFDRTFPALMPHFETPLKNLYIANLDMTYPFDRGTNYAVKLGLQVASSVIMGITGRSSDG